jgi:hypothetical protein
MLGQDGSCPGRNCNDKLPEYMSIELFFWIPTCIILPDASEIRKATLHPTAFETVAQDAPHCFYIVTLVCSFELD